jgi:peroxiredoxin
VLGELYNYYLGQDFVLIAVTKESVTAINGWISTYSVPYAVGKDNGSNTFNAYYGIAGSGVPWHYIIDKHGHWRWHWGVGATLDDYKAQIDALLNE